MSAERGWQGFIGISDRGATVIWRPHQSPRPSLTEPSATAQ
jgi:hypothetical protein